MIYFDNNATTRLFDCVVEAMHPYLTQHYANPASAFAHYAGVTQAVEKEKKRLCNALGFEEREQLIITSGATESNNLAIFGSAKANPDRRHIIISAIEHASVLEVAEALQRDGYRITILPSRSDGVTETDGLLKAISSDTLLVSLMMANNETGVLQPVGKLASIVKEHDDSILVHSDATQAVGKVPIRLDSDLSAVDLLSFSAHKFHGPKGVGALFVRDRRRILPIQYGGGQQSGMRAGTENPAALVGMTTALTKLLSSRDLLKPIEKLRDDLQLAILSAHRGAFALGASADRLPTTLNVCLPGVEAEDLVDCLAMKGIAISAGSACSYGAQRPSHVATALGLSYEQAKSCVRLSLSVESTQAEANSFLRSFTQAISDLTGRPQSSLNAASIPRLVMQDR
ncbi:MAG: cysteine desulfurase family protein [Verrucomicrobiia bacterium]